LNFPGITDEVPDKDFSEKCQPPAFIKPLNQA